MTTPCFTVILPTCNRLAKLRRALASLQQQTLQDFELILVDDGSVDGTGEYLDAKEHADEFPHIRSPVVIRNQTSKGAGIARNQALRRAQGELIAFLDDDDIWFPEYLEQQARRLQENPGAAASCAAHVEFDTGGNTRAPDLEPLFSYEQPIVYLLTESFVHSMSVLVARRSAFQQIGLLNPDLDICHDWDWCARLLLAGHEILPPGGPVVVKREIPGGLVTRLRDWYDEEQAILAPLLRSNPSIRAHAGAIRAYRNLLFARLAISRKDYGFAARKLGQAFLSAPNYSFRLARRKWARSRQTGSDTQE